MSKHTGFQRKIINDPLYGLVTVSNPLIFEILQHSYMQRLRRIQQTGMASLVYPGAMHTRFHHVLGAYHLMGQAIETLRFKGFEISREEAEGAKMAILLHDIGHGPFSHALEHQIVSDTDHEEITKLFMHRLNEQFNGRLETAIAIFENTYPAKFLHQLVSGQLDMDRMDYLMRDSFYAGVNEGIISTDRILKMLTISGDELAVELKGIYSIEKFIVARRLMYWQVYYHKTVLAAEYMLIKILERARYLLALGVELQGSETFLFFLKKPISHEDFINNPKILETFALLDDYDVYATIKSWLHHSDQILSILCKSLVNRELFRVIIDASPIADEKLDEIALKVEQELHLPKGGGKYFTGKGEISNSAYNPDSDRITVVDKAGNQFDISKLSEQLNIALYNATVSKYFCYFPKWAGDLQ